MDAPSAMIHMMDPRQEQELRTWATALAGAQEADRKAMGRAILMLLGQIDSLRAELDRAAAEPPPPPPAAPAEEPAGAEREESTETIAVYDAAPGLLGRLRMPHRPKSTDAD
jgi:hypothetical protein